MNEGIKLLRDLAQKRQAALTAIVAPARAAVNAMKDAGMNRSADPLAEALFQIDAIDAETKAAIQADPRGMIDALLEVMRPPDANS